MITANGDAVTFFMSSKCYSKSSSSSERLFKSQVAHVERCVANMTFADSRGVCSYVRRLFDRVIPHNCVQILGSSTLADSLNPSAAVFYAGNILSATDLWLDSVAPDDRAAMVACADSCKLYRGMKVSNQKYACAKKLIKAMEDDYDEFVEDYQTVTVSYLYRGEKPLLPEAINWSLLDVIGSDTPSSVVTMEVNLNSCFYSVSPSIWAATTSQRKRVSLSVAKMSWIISDDDMDRRVHLDKAVIDIHREGDVIKCIYKSI